MSGKQKEPGMITENDALEMSKFYDVKIAKAEFEIEEIQSRKTNGDTNGM